MMMQSFGSGKNQRYGRWKGGGRTRTPMSAAISLEFANEKFQVFSMNKSNREERIHH